MRIFTTLAPALLLAATVQAQAYEDKIKYEKENQDAFAIEYDYPAEAVENAFVEKMNKLGYKAREEKGILNRDRGFIVFRNALVTDIAEKRYDYIIKVDRKSRKESDVSVLYLLIQDDGENVFEKLKAQEVGDAKRYLNDMLPDIEAANLELQIRDQEDAVAKAEKKLRDLEDEHKTLTRKIADNEASQDDTRKDIENQRLHLETLRGKRTPAN
jgi:hypothetical protein